MKEFLGGWGVERASEWVKRTPSFHTRPQHTQLMRGCVINYICNLNIIFNTLLATNRYTLGVW
jgi:hypothetical protein